MAKNTSSKETILTSIRNALLNTTKLPFPNLEAVDNIYNVTEDHLDILFAQELKNVNGEFIYCENEKECVENIKELVMQNGWENVFCFEERLKQLFDKHQFINYETKKDITEADAGIIMCEALVARTGSILLSSKQESGRTLPIYPTYNIVVASTQQLVLDITDAIAVVRKKYDGNMPSMINLATGPSRTADIEKTLVLGAHGPRGVYVFLIDNLQIDWMKNGSTQ
ncbi:MAG: LUD domain-containing protein [Fimbriimonadaceae bacterium]|nr:LUD domain-containing protein [Chitinophagales bacterium]